MTTSKPYFFFLLKGILSKEKKVFCLIIALVNSKRGLLFHITSSVIIGEKKFFFVFLIAPTCSARLIKSNSTY